MRLVLGLLLCFAIGCSESPPTSNVTDTGHDSGFDRAVICADVGTKPCTRQYECEGCCRVAKITACSAVAGEEEWFCFDDISRSSAIDGGCLLQSPGQICCPK